MSTKTYRDFQICISVHLSNFQGFNHLAISNNTELHPNEKWIFNNYEVNIFKVNTRYIEWMKLFLYMYEIDKFEWFSYMRGNGWKKKSF